MLSFALICNTTISSATISFAVPTTSTSIISSASDPLIQFKTRTFLNKTASAVPNDLKLPSVVSDSLRVLEWDKVCDSVASFAGTSLGQQTTKAQLRAVNQSYEESLRLLEETNAAVEMHKHGGFVMNFSCIDVVLVKSAIQHARSGSPVEGYEAMALVTLLQFAESLQYNLKAEIKEDADVLQRFMPLAETIMDLVVSYPLVKFIQQLIDEDGSVKDSASPVLKRSRDQVHLLEKKLSQLMESLISNAVKDRSSVEVSNINGRWCIKSEAELPSSFEGLLLPSGSGAGSIVEPLSAVSLNDELQLERASVAKAEADVLLKITDKMQEDLDDIEILFHGIIQLDAVNARATYSISFGGTYPELYLAEDKNISLTAEIADDMPVSSHPTQRKWKLYMPKAYHPLLLQQHRQNLEKAKKDIRDANAEIRRIKQQLGNATQIEETMTTLSSLKIQVAELEQSPPVPVDIFVAYKTKVLVITGPNTGGKTICLKTVGLAAMMAKSGLYILAAEPGRIPWVDSVFADIGDEQSLSQSLSTFSGHLKQTSDIQSHSTSQSLVLLDEVGSGTNPLEGAALGMSILESFAEAGVLLTMATTHHGELKTLKYSNDAFENACMEFDEVNLKPTYRILWGIPGRSNAIDIAERLGLPKAVVDNARELFGAASAEINEVIVDMEKFKQNFHEHIHESQNYLKLSRELHENLLLTKRNISRHVMSQKYEKFQEISKAGKRARSTFHNKVRQHRASVKLTSRVDEADKSQQTATSSSQSTSTEEDNSQQTATSSSQSTSTEEGELSMATKTADSLVTVRQPLSDKSQQTATSSSQSTSTEEGELSMVTKTADSLVTVRQPLSEKKAQVPKAGDLVYVSMLSRKATVLKVVPSKEEIVVQAGNMKLKLRLADIVA